MANTLTLSELKDVVRAVIKTEGSQAAAATALGIDIKAINFMLSDREAPSPRLLNALGMEKVVLFQRVGQKKRGDK